MSLASEHETVYVIVIIDEQVTSECLVVDVVGEISWERAENIAVALIEDVLGEVHLRVPLSLIGFLEAIEIVTASQREPCVNRLSLVLLAHLPVELYFVEPVFAHAFVVVAVGERFIVLHHQFGIILVGVECAAVVVELVIAVKSRPVDPLSKKAAVVVLGVCSAVD